MSERRRLDIEVLPQPDDTTCGPTCLQAVYRYWKDPAPLSEVISEISELPEGGTLAVTLACHALGKGFEATIYTYNLQTFDPTWFSDCEQLDDKLRRQGQAKQDPKLNLAIEAYLHFLRLGGEVKHQLLTTEFLRALLDQGPVLTGLSATYLYECARERGESYDDIGGEPTGHFVVISGYEVETDVFFVEDPHHHVGMGTRSYQVHSQHLLAAILLGIVTYDANLLIITPSEWHQP